MSQKIFRLLQRMEKEDLSLQLALQCAPFLAGLKVSNLLIVPDAWLVHLMRRLRGTGILVRRLYRNGEKSVLLLYRKEELERWLTMPEVRRMMVRAGYPSQRPEDVLRQLEEKMGSHGKGEMPFPHELGLLLGYPPEDVRGFVEKGGKECSHTGYWKVYERPEEKRRLFAAFDRATDLAVFLVHKREDVLRLKEIWQKAREQQRKADALQRAAG